MLAWGGKWVVRVALCAVVSGCTQITVIGADGEVTTEIGFGIAKIETDPGRLPQIVRSTGFGIISRDGGVTIGYHSAEIAILPTDDCRIVVWLEEGQSPETLKQITEQNEDVCVIDRNR